VNGVAFRHAIVRPPGSTFARGLTAAQLGAPDLPKALEQHARYCEALEHCGLALVRLEPDPGHPDSTFVEDTAVLTQQGAILTRPGAPSRRGEVGPIGEALTRLGRTLKSIRPPGTLDGGDVCEADGHFFIGVSQRTTEEGARQLADLLAAEGHGSTQIDVRGIAAALHLKSGLAHLDGRRLAAIGPIARLAGFDGYDILVVDPAEAYAANCVNVNGRLLLPAGFPRLQGELMRLGHTTIALEMSEFEKMDGGVSCLSLRF
jgi:dimethylargininase